MRLAPPATAAAVALAVLQAPLAAQTYDQLSARARAFVAVPEPAVALTHVTLIDGTGAPVATDQTIVISAGRIATVGPAASTQVPAGARTIDGTGKTVLPGIVGMHDHTFYTTSQRSTQLNFSGPQLYLGSGVTSIRTTGSYSPYSELNLKRETDRGGIAGPRMWVTGPYLTGETGVGSMLNLLTPADARRVVDYWAAEGATWLKFYTTVSREVMGAAIDEAHRKGIKVTGHLCSVSFREAVALGIDNLEHSLFANTDWDPEKKPDSCPMGAGGRLAHVDMRGEGVRATIRDMVRKKVAMTSTLAVYELFVPNRPPLEQRVLDAMAPEVRTEYLQSRTRISESPALGISSVTFRKAMDFDTMFVRAGGLLAAGVDPTGNGGALPGFGDQRNYELLLEAGFTVPEAVRIMTLNGATILGRASDLGSVERGKIADLVVIDADLPAKPAEIRNVSLVFKDGVGYDARKLVEATKGQVGVR